MQAEEAVGDLPGGDERFAGLEKRGHPGRRADMSIEGHEHVVNHPEDGLAALGLAEIVALTGMPHLLDSQFAGCDEGRKEIEVICTTGLDHRHRGDRQIDALPDIGGDGLPDGLEGVAKDFFDFHIWNTDPTDLTDYSAEAEARAG